jgi:hypothetical protein
MDLKTAAKRFRKWQKDGMVIVSCNGNYTHITKAMRSQELFVRTTFALNGDVLDRYQKGDVYVTLVNLPKAAFPLIEPRSSRGRPAGTKGGGRPKLPEGQHRIQQGARFHPDTKPLAEAIADKLELDNWAWAVDEWAVDEAVRRMAKEEGIKIK